MIRFIGFAVVIAIVTVLFAYVFDIFQNLKFRKHLLLVCGLLLVAIVLIVNPQQEPGASRDLYNLKLFSPLLLLPFFILAPLPYIEKINGIVLSKRSVLFGSFLTSQFYFVIWQFGDYYFGQYWLAEGLVWTVCTLVPASLIFFGISLGEQSLSRTTDEDPSKSEKITESFPREVIQILIVIGYVLVFLLPFFLLGSLGTTESCGGYPVYIVNQIPNSDVTVIHMNDEELRGYPKLEFLFKNTQIPSTNSTKIIGNNETNVTYLGWIQIACRDQSLMEKYRALYGYIEYKGRFYYADLMQIH